MDFADAAGFIKDLQGECDYVLVAIDQPIIVCNQSGTRPVDRVAGSLMSKLHGATQPANRNKATMFGNDAPVRKSINRIKSPGMISQDLKDC